jgi:hypothetical protein
LVPAQSVAQESVEDAIGQAMDVSAQRPRRQRLAAALDGV